jgi:uncharacterized membrane protein YebE (DUF533 family)
MTDDDTKEDAGPSDSGEKSTLGQKILKGAAIAVGAVVVIGLSKWLLKTAIFFGLLGGAGYVGYRLLSKKQVTSGDKSPALLTDGKSDANQFQAELERFKEENKRLDEKLKDLS